MTQESFASRCDEGNVSFAAGLLCALDLRVADGFQPTDLTYATYQRGEETEYTFARSTRLGFIVGRGSIRMQVWRLRGCLLDKRKLRPCACPSVSMRWCDLARALQSTPRGHAIWVRDIPWRKGVLVNTLELRCRRQVAVLWETVSHSSSSTKGNAFYISRYVAS